MDRSSQSSIVGTSQCPPHYRVQMEDCQDGWRLVQSFRTPQDAARCLADIEESGGRARIVHYRLCPTGA